MSFGWNSCVRDYANLQTELPKEQEKSASHSARQNQPARLFHVPSNGAPVCDRLYAPLDPTPMAKRLSTLSVFRVDCGIGRLRIDRVNFDLVVKRLPSDAETFGGFQFVSARFFENFFDGIALHRFHEGEIFRFSLADYRCDG